MEQDGLVELTFPSDGVAEVTFGDPEISNNVSWAGAAAIAKALGTARSGGARVLVISSATPGHWLEHAWLRDVLATVAGQPATADGRGFGDVMTELARPEVLMIAAVDGATSGGGCEIGWACDLRVASESATFAQPEVALGISTGIGGTSRLARLVGPTLAAEMVLDGRPVTARRLHEAGAINRLVPAGEARHHALDWATELATRPHQSVTTMKRLLRESLDLNLTESLQAEQSAFRRLVSTPEAIEIMQREQARHDQGRLPSRLVGEPAH